MSLNGQLFIDGLAIGLIFVILATGLVLITSVTRILFMAYGAFYAIGAFTTWSLINYLNIPYFYSLIIAVLCTGILGGLCYILVFDSLMKKEEGFLATLIASLGLNMVLTQGDLLIFGTTVRGIPSVFTGSLSIFGITITVAKIALMLIRVVVAIVLFLIYERTKIGRAMRTVAFNPEIASLQGINVKLVFIMTMGLGTALAGISGAILAPSYGWDPGMGNSVLWSVMLMAMLGGMDSLLGAVVAGIIIGQLLSFGQFYIGGTVQIIIFIIIGVVLYFKPNGLLGRGIELGI